MHGPNTLSATELLVGLRSRALRARDVVEACLERIALREPEIHAWTIVDAESARRQARVLDAGPLRGPLHGLPIGVKDIFDTAGLPTEYGSPIYAGHRPGADAACVAAARAAGAIVLGKTATTEFACYSPAATVNPRNPAHTPGGSSSGSAAAVADGMVPVGLGTQTAGSIIRPASYCGVVGYKPTYGTIDRRGLKLVAGSLDTIGVLTRTVADAALLVGSVAGRPDLAQPAAHDGVPRIGVCRSHERSALQPEMAAALEAVAERLSAAGARVVPIELPDAFADLDDAHAAIQGFEAARNLGAELREHRSLLTPRLLEMLDAGARLPVETYETARQVADACRAALSSAMGECRVLIAASATGEAPAGLESTGSPVMNRTWTLLHAPCVNVPGLTGPSGLPVGVQIIGRVSDDATTLAAATWVEERLRT